MSKKMIKKMSSLNFGTIDKKHKLNVNPNKEINAKILEKIESGIDSEYLLELQKSGLNIFSYYTQITIHGIFPVLQVQRLHGYKNLFQNKNKSIGIRYSAIDYKKIEKILDSEKYQYSDFHFYRNSSERYFFIQKSVTKDNFQEKLREFKVIRDNFNNAKIDFIGSCEIYHFSCFGTHFLAIKLYVNRIFWNDTNKFIDLFLTDQELEKRKIEKIQKDNKYKAEEEKNELIKQENIKKAKIQKDKLLIENKHFYNWLNDNFKLVNSNEIELDKSYIKQFVRHYNNESIIDSEYQFKNGYTQSKVLYLVKLYSKETKRSRKVYRYSKAFETLKECILYIKENKLKSYSNKSYRNYDINRCNVNNFFKLTIKGM